MKREKSGVAGVLLALGVVVALTGLIVSCRAAPAPSPVPTTASPAVPAATPTSEPTPSPTIDPRLTTLYIASPFEANTFDPQVNVALTTGRELCPTIYETLVWYEPDGTLGPMLAEGWEIMEDGLLYRFKLREDVLFSDGTPFNAEAVKAAFDRFFALGKGTLNLYTSVDEVLVVDDYTVDIRLKEPFAPFLAVLAGWQGSIFVSPTAVEEHEKEGDLAEEWLYDHTAGTGPFMLESWEEGARVELVRNPYYREPWAPDDIQRQVFLIVREAATTRLLLEGGDVDIADELAPALLEPLRQAEGVELRLGMSLSYVGSVWWNMTKEPFNDVNFRRAISYALDYDALVQLYEGIAVQAHGPLHPGVAPWFSPESIQYHQDLDKAADLLGQAGYSVPIDPPLKLVFNWQSGFSVQRDVATLMHEDLSTLGIELEIMETELPVWREKIWSKEFDMLFARGGLAYGDPDAYFARYLHSGEIRHGGFNPGYSNPRVDEVIDLARKEVDQEQRRQYYNELQRIVTDEAAFLWLVTRQNPYAYGTNITGIEWNTYYGNHWNGAEIKKTGLR